jgi:hypothetical protein
LIIDSGQEPNAFLFKVKQSKKIDKPEVGGTMLLPNMLPFTSQQDGISQKTGESPSLLSEP